MTLQEEYRGTLHELLTRSIVLGKDDFIELFLTTSKKPSVTLSKEEFYWATAKNISSGHKNIFDYITRNEEKLRTIEPDDTDRLRVVQSRDNPESIELKWVSPDNYIGLIGAKKKNSLTDPFNGHPKIEAETAAPHLPSQFFGQIEKTIETEGKGKQPSSKVLLTTSTSK